MLFARLRRRLRALLKRDKLEQELADELRYHLERDTEQNLKSGMKPDEAYYAALKALEMSTSRKKSVGMLGVCSLWKT